MDEKIIRPDFASVKTEYKELLKEFEHPSWIEMVKPAK